MSDARAVITEAQKWLDDHPNHHSARRGDVKALIKALEAVLTAPVGEPEVEMQYALQVPGSVVRNEPHRIWTNLEEAQTHADMLKDTFGDTYEIVERRKAGPWSVRKA